MNTHPNNRLIEATRVPHPQIASAILPVAIRLIHIAFVTRETGDWPPAPPHAAKNDVLPSAMRYDATVIYLVGGIPPVMVQESYEEIVGRIREASAEPEISLQPRP